MVSKRHLKKKKAHDDTTNPEELWTADVKRLIDVGFLISDADNQKSNAALLKNMKSKLHYPSAGLALDFGNDKQEERTRLSLLTISKRAKYRPIYPYKYAPESRHAIFHIILVD